MRIAWLLAALAVVGASTSVAAPVIVLRSGDEAPYRAASARAAELVRNQSGEAKEASLAEWAGTGRSEVETIIAIGTEAAKRAAKDAPAGASVFFCMVADPMAAGLLEPGGRVRGVLMEPGADEQIRLIQRAIPNVKSIGLLYSSASPASAELLERAKAVTPGGITLNAVDISNHASASEAIEALLARSPDCIWTRPDPAVYDAAVIRAVLLAALRRGTPVFGYSAAVVRAGALIGVAVTPEAQGEAAAMMALGQTPDDRTVAPPRWEIALNLEVADRLEVAIPAELIKDAGTVFRKP